MAQAARGSDAMSWRIAIAALAAAAVVPAGAAEPAGAGQMRAIEREVPAQPWYPDFYYDIRIAAEAELAETPVAGDELAEDWGDGSQYDILGCGGFFIVPEDADEATRRYGNAALEIARMRRDLEAIGYPADIYAAPLAAYERHLVEQAKARTGDEVLMALGIGPDEFDEAWPGSASEPAWEDAPEAGPEPAAELARAIEENRARIAPHLPKVAAEGGCGDAPPAPVIVRTDPPGATVLLISAFAFKVCIRKLADPWDALACRWNEIETGTPTLLRGRIVYQVRWTDGTHRRGARELDLNYDDDEPTLVTFRKTGG